MEISNIGTIIASRELALSGGQKVTVAIGLPVPFPDEKDFYCPFRITGIGDGKIRHAGGIDSVQALFLALQKIGIILSTSNESKEGNLMWLDNKNLGFPSV